MVISLDIVNAFNSLPWTAVRRALKWHRVPLHLKRLKVGEERIRVQETLKYLGITLDSRLAYGDHFSRLEKRTVQVANLLGRLLPNTKGPGETLVRWNYKIHDAIQCSSIVHGSYEKPPKYRNIKRCKIRRIQSTVSYHAAVTGAGMILLDVQAEAEARVYCQMRS